MKNNIKKWIRNALNMLKVKGRISKVRDPDRKKVGIFVVCLILAFCLWLVVNLNRNYTINLNLPLALGKISTKQALAEKLPRDITATVSGQGWYLIKLFNNPPDILIDVTNQQVNLLQQTRNQIGNQNFRVQKVSPFYLQPKLVPKQTRKVPVVANVNVQFAKQYGFLQEPSISPDSIIISGSRLNLKGIHQWPTDSISLNNVKKDLSLSVPLKEPPPLIQLSTPAVRYHADVVKLTNDKVTVPVKKKNFPPGRMVTFIPSSVTIEYEVPLNEYKKVTSTQPFKAFVTYQQFKKDSTGFLKPKIKQLIDNVHIEVRSVEPSEINYFTIISNENGIKF